MSLYTQWQEITNKIVSSNDMCDMILNHKGNYTVLEYIRFTGTQRININITPTNTMGFYLDANISSGATGSSSGGNGKTIIDGRNSGIVLYYMGDRYTVSYSDGKNKRRIWIIDYKNNKVGYSENSIENIQTMTTTSSPGGVPYILGAWYENGTYYYDMSAYVYSMKVYNNNSIIRDIVPVKRNKDNVIGLYDKVTKVLYMNQGTGSFIAGPETEIQIL